MDRSKSTTFLSEERKIQAG